VINLDRFWAGEKGYFDELVRTYGPVVQSVAEVYGRDTDHADNLYQEIWTRLFQKRRHYSEEGRFVAWIRRVAINVCVEDFRAQKVRSKGMARLEALGETGIACGGDEDPLAKVEKEEKRLVLHRAFDHLPPRQMEVIKKRYLEGQNSKEIAETMGIAPATVRSLARKAIARLRKIVKGFSQ